MNNHLTWHWEGSSYANTPDDGIAVPKCKTLSMCIVIGNIFTSVQKMQENYICYFLDFKREVHLIKYVPWMRMW